MAFSGLSEKGGNVSVTGGLPNIPGNFCGGTPRHSLSEGWATSLRVGRGHPSLETQLQSFIFPFPLLTPLLHQREHLTKETLG